MGAQIKSDPAERRQFKRYALVGQLPAQLGRKNGDILRMHVQDLSRDGLGVVLTSELHKNEIVTLTWQNDLYPPTSVKVVWTREVEDDGGVLYHCGLHVLDNSVDLESEARSCDFLTLDELD